MLCQHYVPIVRFMHLQPTSSFKCAVLVQIIKCEPTFNKDIQPYIYTNCCFNYEFKILPKSNRMTFNLFFFFFEGRHLQDYDVENLCECHKTCKTSCDPQNGKTYY